MWLIDQWAERYIAEAQRGGVFDNLSGSGEPLVLDDDSHIEPELRAAYRLLKNAGYLPPELELRREALELRDLLRSVHKQHADYPALRKRLALLELRLGQAGMSTDFLHGEYADKVLQRIKEE